MIDLGSQNAIDGYDQINVILGKNGSGKSTLLRLMDSRLSGQEACIRYITPERGGDLKYDGNIETNRSNNPNWWSKTRRSNRWGQFRESSVAEFRNLETLVLRSIELDKIIRKSDFSFDTEIAKINQTLDRVKIGRSTAAGFDIIRKSDEQIVSALDLSSGESELISLAIEIMYFSYLCGQEKHRETDNWLLLDEPDVHLHPDLQQRLMKFLVDSMEGVNGRVAIATHSTVVLSSLCASSPNVRIGFKEFGNQLLSFRPTNDILKSILPMFGTHPLSSVFNKKPPLILEGEDDERIWQSAARSSQGRISIYPCVAGDVQSINRHEISANEVISSVYDNAKAFSLRDRDDTQYEIDDLGSVVRCRLMCRCSENLIVSDDVLSELGTDWDTLRIMIERWITDNPSHSQSPDAVAFQDGGWDRMGFRIKNLRNVIVTICGSTKPWEVSVGQAIAKLPASRFDGEHSLKNYLGPKLVEALQLEG